MVEFYGGLAEVLEQNMDEPERCVKQADDYIASHVGPLQELMKRSRMNAQSNPPSSGKAALTREDQAKIGQAMNEMSRSEGFQAMNRFLSAFEEFAGKYPDHADRIGEILERYHLER